MSLAIRESVEATVQAMAARVGSNFTEEEVRAALADDRTTAALRRLGEKAGG